jgi:hypothetical protein
VRGHRCLRQGAADAAAAEAGAFSKKDAGLRRRELLGSGEGSLAVQVASLCAAHARELLVCSKGSQVLVEVATGAQEGGLASPAALHQPPGRACFAIEGLCA